MKPKVIRYWSDVVSRAAKETAAMTPWSSKGKLVVGLGSALLAGALIYSLTGNWLQSGLIALVVTLGMALVVFLWKMVTTPAALAAEAAIALASVRSTEDEAGLTEKARRRQLMDRLVQLYLLKEDADVEIEAGLALPPMDWLNEHLAIHDEAWQIIEIRGTAYSTLELRPMTPNEKHMLASRSARAVF